MNINNIVNRNLVTLQNCEDEPIHIPGSIQNFGFLLAIHKDTHIIEFASENATRFLSVSLKELIGANADLLMNANAIGYISETIEKNKNLYPSFPIGIYIAQKSFSCTVHISGNYFILECEAEESNLPVITNVYEQTRIFLSFIGESITFKQLCESVVKETRHITGYDRVMVYKFDDYYNGEVIAESKREDLESFLGLHYPHTDIPPQARELYMKNLLRMIVDINYTPTPIFTGSNKTNADLDLSYSILRSTSPIHVQYLQNMGVGATLTISLIHKGKLWGLIACHHYSQKTINQSTRVAAQLQSHFLTSQIDIRQANEEYLVAQKCNEAFEHINNLLASKNPDVFAKIITDKKLLEVCNASGVAIYSNGQMIKAGITPDDQSIIKLVEAIREKHNKNEFHTEQITMLGSQLSYLDEKAAGVLYFDMGFDADDFIVWLKQESEKEINWAGEPEKAIIKDAKGLHPRNSFAKWKEVIKGKSEKWLEPEINASSNLVHALQRYMLYKELYNEEEKYRLLSKNLQESNDELENINWISTHDLQEPLRKIQMMASRYMEQVEEGISQDVTLNTINRMMNAANKMQILIKDILSYSYIKNLDEKKEMVDLNMVLTNVLADAEDSIKEHKAQVILGELPKVHGNTLMLKQLFSNLLNNALKFTDHAKQQTITIKQLQNSDTARYHIQLSDTGIGFDPQYATSIFKLFKRLHSDRELAGTGVGLALCKKIVENHKGTIEAEGILNEGAVFTIHFPVEDKCGIKDNRTL